MSVTHMGPAADGGRMPCCGRTPFEVPADDRVTYLPYNVTCADPEEVRERAVQDVLAAMGEGEQDEAWRLSVCIFYKGPWEFVTDLANGLRRDCTLRWILEGTEPWWTPKGWLNWLARLADDRDRRWRNRYAARHDDPPAMWKRR